MNIIAIERNICGTSFSRKLRNTGKVPGIIYGGGEKERNIILDHNTLYRVLHKEEFNSSILSIDIKDSKLEKVLLRDYQVHPFKPLILHIDFQRVIDKQRIHTKVPLHFINAMSSPAIKFNKAIISHVITELEISCLPENLPKYIEICLSKLEVGQSIHAKDIILPIGVTLLSYIEHENPVIANAHIPAGNIESKDTELNDTTSKEEKK